MTRSIDIQDEIRQLSDMNLKRILNKYEKFLEEIPKNVERNSFSGCLEW